MKDFTTDQLEAQKEAELYDLFKNNSDSFPIHESVLIKAMAIAGIEYFGAIDPQDQEALFQEYGIQFLPNSNNGEYMWRGIRL